MDGKKWVTLKDGRRILINDYMNNKIRKEAKGKTEEQTDGKPNYETAEEHTKRLIENQKKQHEYEEERDKKLQELYKKNSYDDEEFLKIMDEYNKKIDELRQPVIYDEKSQRYIKLSSENVFTDKSKVYDGRQKVNLTPEEENALTNYTSQYGDGSYGTINRYLYEDQISMFSDKERIEKNINTISRAMDKNQIGGNYQVYRGIEPDRLNDPKLEQAVTKINKAVEKGGTRGLDKYVDELYSHIGDKIENKGFVSTSTTIDPNYLKRGATFVINTKPTDKAIDIKAISKYGGKQDTQFAFLSKGGIQKESEILYNKNTNLIIKDIAITKSGVFFLCDTEQK